MVKILGIVLLLAGFCGLSMEKIREEKEEIKVLLEIKEFSVFLLKEIEYSHIPIPDICKEYKMRCNGKIRAFLDKVCETYESDGGKTFYHVWEKEVDNYPGSSKGKKWLYKMGKEFGFGNVGMQISAMESYKDFIQKEILQKEKKFQDNKKLILYFGVMSGLLLSIILL